jgi:hypothetical protein
VTRAATGRESSPPPPPLLDVPASRCAGSRQSLKHHSGAGSSIHPKFSRPWCFLDSSREDVAAAACSSTPHLAGEHVSGGVGWWRGELPWLLAGGKERKSVSFAGHILSPHSFTAADEPTVIWGLEYPSFRCRRVGWWTGSGCVPRVATAGMAASAKGAPGPTDSAGLMVRTSKFHPPFQIIQFLLTR